MRADKNHSPNIPSYAKKCRKLRVRTDIGNQKQQALHKGIHHKLTKFRKEMERKKLKPFQK
jgi:hypothetical protein